MNDNNIAELFGVDPKEVADVLVGKFEEATKDHAQLVDEVIQIGRENFTQSGVRQIFDGFVLGYFAGKEEGE